ncbi:Retrotransposon gag domain [Dillenia turbinata]|uniref:Retrotransposon gag domain n=1 Tax=Dillenia turbinata TaxID=194707 RepID=A0AAN8VAK8_9MAGN
MARGRGRARGPKVKAPAHERDLRDIEIEELRRQIQHLEARLEQSQTQAEGASLIDNEDLNPFASTHISEHYRQDNFLKLHNLRQIDLSVEEYTIEFELLLLKCDVVESKEQTIARYLGGLNEEIGNAVRLQPYYSFNDVRKLAVIVEKQQKTFSKSRFKSTQKSSSFNQGTSSSSRSVSSANPITKASFNSGNGKQFANSNSSSRKCFKYQGYGHIASECPNRKAFTIVENEAFEDKPEHSESVDEEKGFILLSKSLLPV